MRKEVTPSLRIALAQFSIENEGKPYFDVMSVWNDRYPQWAFDNSARFGRALRNSRLFAMRESAIPLLAPRPGRTHRRLQALSEKHRSLASFTRERNGRPLKDRMSEWNALYPGWAYTRVSNFGWDSQQSVTRTAARDAHVAAVREQRMREFVDELTPDETERLRQMLDELRGE